VTSNHLKPPVSTFCVALCIFVIGDRKVSKFDSLNVQVTAYRQQTVPDRGVVR